MPGTLSKWAAEHAAELGASPSTGFVVGGVSAGGNLAAVVTHQAKDERLNPKLTGQWLSVPLLLHESVVPEQHKPLHFSNTQNAAIPLFGKADVEVIMDTYAANYHSPLFSPFSRASGLAGLPPAYLQACGMDMWRDDALVYERALRE
jgi:acetyl esterase/lipase